MKKINEVKKIEIKASPVHYITGIVFIALMSLAVFFLLRPTTKRVLLENGTIEKTRIVTSYIVKQEGIIKKDIEKVLIPVIAEGSKTQKGGIIATYKGKEYKNYEQTLSKMDAEILELMNDLPVIYSSEINTIDSSIYELVKKSSDETSFAKMQEYKQKINTYINKRATIIGELSPNGAEIKDLIKQRNEFEENAKKSNDNVLAPITGLVSYKTDGLETKLSVKDINNLSYSYIKENIDNSNLIDNTSIKVVNNYEAYIVTKVPLEDKEYIKNNYNYTLRLIESNNHEIKGELVRYEEKEDGIETYFKITNGIEELIDLREIELEIIWWKTTGLVVSKEALVKYEDKEAYYVYAIKYSEIVEVPVKVSKQNDKYAIVTNYSKEELQELQIETDYTIKLHDRLIIRNAK